MDIIYGMPTLIEYTSIESNILLCKSLQLKFLELNMNMIYCLPENNNIDKLKALKDKHNIKFTMHFPEEIDFGSFYDEISNANIQLFERYAKYGSKIGVEKINIHLNPGTLVTLPEKKVWSYERYVDKYLDNLKKSFEKITKIASTYNIKVCIENVLTPKFLENVFFELAKIDNIFFTYDIGHDAKTNYSVENIYKKLDKKVIHMHLHDYDNKTDHQILFKGIINLYDKLSFAKSNNMSVVIEVKTSEALKKSVENLIIRNLK